MKLNRNYEFKKGFLLIGLSTILVINPMLVFAESDDSFPSWIKDLAKFWVDDQISDEEFIKSLQYLLDNDFLIIKQDSPNTISDIQNIENQIIKKTKDGIPILGIGQTFTDNLTDESYSVMMSISREILTDEYTTRGYSQWVTMMDEKTDGFDWKNLKIQIMTENENRISPFWFNGISYYELPFDDKPRYLVLSVDDDLVFWDMMISDKSYQIESCLVLDKYNSEINNDSLHVKIQDAFVNSDNILQVSVRPDNPPGRYVSMQVLDFDNSVLFSDSYSFSNSLGSVEQVTIPDDFDHSMSITVRACVEGGFDNTMEIVQDTIR